MLGLLGIRPFIYLGIGIALWFAYGWGMSIIQTYNDNIVRVATLERAATLREARLATKQTVIERYQAAVGMSKCKAEIEHLLKNPDLLIKRDPFNTNSGG